MFDFLTWGADRLQIFMLVNFRVSGIFLAAPIFGDNTIPKLVKVGLVITIAILLMPVIVTSSIPKIPSLVDLAALGVNEVLTGVLIGLLLKILFYAVQAAGSFLGFQSGLSIANTVDPATQQEVNVIGEFWFLVAGVIFLAIDGHHLILSALSDSYKIIPPGGAVFGASAADLFIRLTGVMFTMAVKLAAPILVTVFLVDVALGALARTMPQMNIFVIGIPVKIAITIILIAMTLPVFAWALEKMTLYLDGNLENMLGALASGR